MHFLNTVTIAIISTAPLSMAVPVPPSALIGDPRAVGSLTKANPRITACIPVAGSSAGFPDIGSSGSGSGGPQGPPPGPAPGDPRFTSGLTGPPVPGPSTPNKPSSNGNGPSGSGSGPSSGKPAAGSSAGKPTGPYFSNPAAGSSYGFPSAGSGS